MLLIANYSFDWQMPYVYAPPGKKLPKGTSRMPGPLRQFGVQSIQPGSSATVRDGPQTYHEMMNGFVFYVDAGEKLGLAIDEKTGRVKK